MVNSIRDLIVALSCVAMLNVAAVAQAQTAVTSDLPVVGGRQGIQPGVQQPASTSVSEPLPLKLGGSAPPAVESVARVEQMPEFKTTVVYLGDLPLLSVAAVEEAAIERASTISARINQWHWDRLSGNAIQVHYDGQHYAISAGKDQPLLSIDKSIEVDAQDTLSDRAMALLIANRLRRYFGDAPPLTEVQGNTLIADASALLQTLQGNVVQVFQGIASWYGGSFLNRRTSSGVVLRSDSMLAAHRSLPFGTRLRVTNLNNGRSVTVKVQDRGPFIPGRVLDLSPRAAEILGMVNSGLARVKVEVIR